jgi:hypothetical protein
MLASGSIELYFYDELDELSRAETEHHLATCAECRHALDELRLIRAALAPRATVAAPPGDDWFGFMARLDRAIKTERPVPAAQTAPAGRILRGFAGYLAMAALLALVTLSVAYVIRSRPVTGTDPVVAGGTGTVPSLGTPASAARRWSDDAAFAALSEQHFDRAKLVVLGLASRDPREAAAGEWEYERQLASSLLSDTRLYRLVAEERGLTSLARIMGDLELVLLQASMSRDPEPATLEQIQSLIRKRDLVAKMNVVTVAGM